jgi:uncharacterized cupin superfamily protein
MFSTLVCKANGGRQTLNSEARGAEIVKYSLKGCFSITLEGREPIHLQAGDVVQFPKDLRAKWEIDETVRKVFFLSSDQVLDL